jgi:YegS/Rv2252/BmrU family lipid kinase
MRYFLIYNPTSKQGRSKKKWEKILHIFKKKKVVFDYKLTEKEDYATYLASRAAEEGWDVIVSVGGDGTISEVITGLFEAKESKTRPKLGVLHVGTSPDFNRYHNIPTDIEDAVATILKGRTKLVDIGKVTYSKKNNEIPVEMLNIHPDRKISYFGSNVNIGLGPLVASKANGRFRKFLGDFWGTLLATVVSLLSIKDFILTINMDEKEKILSDIINLTVGKDPYLASGMRVFSRIKPDDGRFYVFSVQKTSPISLLLNIPRVYWGDFLKYKGADLKYCKKMEIRYNGKYPKLEFDGDVKGYLPARVNLLHRALEVIVP